MPPAPSFLRSLKSPSALSFAGLAAAFPAGPGLPGGLPACVSWKAWVDCTAGEGAAPWSPGAVVSPRAAPGPTGPVVVPRSAPGPTGAVVAPRSPDGRGGALAV